MLLIVQLPLSLQNVMSPILQHYFGALVCRLDDNVLVPLQLLRATLSALERLLLGNRPKINRQKVSWLSAINWRRASEA